jgi:hypothetical protein
VADSREAPQQQGAGQNTGSLGHDRGGPAEPRRDRRRAARRHPVLRGLGIAALILLGLLAAARIVLDPLVASRTRQALNSKPNVRGTFSRVAVSVVHLSYTIENLRVDKRLPGGEWASFITARTVEAGLYWTELVHGHLVGGILAQRPKIELHLGAEPKKQPSQLPENIGALLQQFTPFRLDRVEVRGGEVLVVNDNVPQRPRLWFHDMEATLENFSTSNALGRGEPTVLALSSTLQRSGKLSIFASADPLAKGLTFSGSAQLRDLELRELGEYLSATTDFNPERGTLDMLARFQAVDGRLSGGVRPIARNASVKQAKPGLGAKIKSALADAALKILSDRVPNRNAVATTIPIHGNLDAPNTPIWPTIIGVVRNAFVAGLAESVEGLPPKGAKESAAAQARKPATSSRAEEGGASP